MTFLNCKGVKTLFLSTLLCLLFCKSLFAFERFLTDLSVPNKHAMLSSSKNFNAVGKDTPSPTMCPTVQPTDPTATPSGIPTLIPSINPSFDPSALPSLSPTVTQTGLPTFYPTTLPSYPPTLIPTQSPSDMPTFLPTFAPTLLPTSYPTSYSSVNPTQSPSFNPSSYPTISPSVCTTIGPTSFPSASPTSSPFACPTSFPSTNPSLSPTPFPTLSPTSSSSSYPSYIPTSIHSLNPSSSPSSNPTSSPSSSPTISSTSVPSSCPTSAPSCSPTSSSAFISTPIPSIITTLIPSSYPSLKPTAYITDSPTGSPSLSPSLKPSFQPSVYPSIYPSKVDLLLPSSIPTGSLFSSSPSLHPTSDPSVIPSSQPSISPSASLTDSPSAYPSAAPSAQSTFIPTLTTTKAPFQNSSEPSSQPSFKPSFHSPTPKPSNTPSTTPTAYPSVNSIQPPFIHLINSNETDSSITLVYTFSTSTIFSGTIYCSAFPNGTTTKNIVSSVVIGATNPLPYSATSSGAKFYSVIILQLTPSIIYNTYCYLKNEVNSQYTSTQVLATKQTISTLCCKSVQFTNAPTSIYNDPSAYPVSTPLSAYSFSFTLSALPNVVLVVTPTLTSDSNALIPYLTITPASFTFLPSSSLKSSFVITSLSTTLTGSVMLTFRLSGQSSSEYGNVPSKTVQIQSVSGASNSPPPKLFSAQFSTSGNTIDITFDSPTNEADILLNPWPCSLLFEFKKAYDTQCSWVTNSLIWATFQSLANSNSSEYLSIGDVISLKNATLKSAGVKADCTLNGVCSSSQSVGVTAPPNPVTPSPNLVVPTVVGPCDNLTIDATQSKGSGGRQWKSVIWTVTSVSAASGQNNNVTKLGDLLNSYGVNIYLPIIIPRSLLGADLYTISLELSNFLGAVGYASTQFRLSINPNYPKVSLTAQGAVSILSSQSWTLASIVQFSSCASAITQLEYSWQAYLDKKLLTNVSSVSADPSICKYLAYSFSVGNAYSVVLNVTVPAVGEYPAVIASASVQLHINSGSIVSIVIGGGYRQFPADQSLQLDASNSYDENYAPHTTVLSFLWSCQIVSLSNFGENCNYIFGGQENNNNITIAAYSMNSLYLYAFQILVTSQDGTRSSSQTVNVQPIPAKSPIVLIASTFTNAFDPIKPLSIIGIIKGEVPLTAYWSAYENNALVVLSANSQLTQNISQSMALNTFSFPLVVSGGAFTGGQKVTFRLTASQAVSSMNGLTSYAEIVLTVNSPPSGGQIFSSPAIGYGLVTDFTISTYQWSSYSANYPLSFEFSYSVSTNQTNLYLQSISSNNVVQTKLPAGYSGYKYQIGLLVTVYDSLNSSSTASTIVTVYDADNVNVTDYLTNGVQVGSLASNNAAVQTAVNNAAIYINKGNCSNVNVTYCSALNRQPCSTTPQTCSDCLAGFYGIVGASNTPCVAAVINSFSLFESRSCESDLNCISAFEICNTTTMACEQLPIRCPSSTMEECSGHGSCSYFDFSGNPILTQCYVTDTQCNARCACEAGYKGLDCSLNPSASEERDSNRGFMCTSLLQLIQSSDNSSNLLDSLSTSLLQAFDPYEVSSSASMQSCQTLLSLMSSIASSGYLTGAKTSTLQTFNEIISEFIEVAPPVISNQTVAPNNSTVDSSQSIYIDAIVSSFTQGILSALQDNENPVDIASNNVRLKVLRSLSVNLDDMMLKAPLTAANYYYNGPSDTTSSFAFAGSGSQTCAQDNGYVHMSLTQWGINPIPNSQNIKTPVLRLSVSSSGTSDSSTTVIANEPVYFLTLQFFSGKNASHSTDSSHRVNTTFPVCNVYNPSSSSGSYSVCDNCEVSSYTSMNVTFNCYDISQICASSNTVATADVSRLAVGSLSSLAKQYGAIVKSVANVIVSVLSVNPFALNPDQSKGVLAFVGILTLILILGTIYFVRWDRLDHHYLVYAKSEADQQHFNRLKEQINELESSDQVLYEYNQKLHKISQQKLRESSNPTASLRRFRNWLDMRKNNFFRSYHFNGEGLKREAGYKTNHLSIRVQMMNKSYAQVMVDSFMNAVMPPDSLLKHFNPIQKFVSAVIQEHDYTSMFVGASLSRNRCVRWYNLYSGILISCFVDTIFFQVFYPDDGYCQSLNNQFDCNAPQNGVTATNMCTWTADLSNTNGGSCTFNSPPTDPTFVLLLALICYTVSLPLIFLYSYILFEICSKRPELEIFGLDAEYYLGRSTNAITSDIGPGNSTLMKVANEIKRNAHQQAVVTKASNIERAELLTLNYQPTGSGKESSGVDNLARSSYFYFTSVSEEADHVIRRINDFLSDRTSIAVEVSSEQASLPVVKTARSLATFRLITARLGIDATGRTATLSLIDRMIYGNLRNKIINKLQKSRAKAQTILKALDNMGELEVENKDVSLLQSFILEQFSPFKQYILKYQMFAFDAATPATIHPITWLLAWIFVVFSNLFFIYWILAWSLSNGNAVFVNWGVNFIIQVVEDIFFIQMFRIFVVYLLAMTSIRPQLKYIFRVLDKIAVSFAQGNLEKEASESDHIVISQHLSGACRAARMIKANTLASAIILRHMDDCDAELCRFDRDHKLSIITTLTIAVPIVVGVLNAEAGDNAIKGMLQSVFSSFILANALLFSISPYLLIVVYGPLLYWLLSRFFKWNKHFRSTLFATTQPSNSGLSVIASPIRHRKNVLTMRYQFQVLLKKAFVFLIEIPDAFLNAFKIFIPKSRTDGMASNWKAMNILANWQGVENDIPTHHYLHDSYGEVSFLQIPSAVVEIQLTNASSSFDCNESTTKDKGMQPDESNFIHRLLHNCVKRSPSDDESGSNQFHEELNSTKSFDNGGLAKHFVEEHLISYDPEEALQRMIRKYRNHTLITQEMKDAKDTIIYELMHEDDDNSHLISISKLFSILDSIWNIYYPNGLKLNAEERMEAVTNLNVWLINMKLSNRFFSMLEKKKKEAIEFDDSMMEMKQSNDLTSFEKESVRLIDFKLWFLEFVERINRCRS